MSFKAKIFLFLKMTSFALIFATLAGAFFVISVINQAKPLITILEGAENKRSEEYATTIEKGSFVLKRDIEQFYLFTQTDDPFQNWLSELLERGVLVAEGERFIVNQSFKLNPLVTNECQELYCFQHIIGFEKIPSTLWKGLIGIEDLRFITHKGIDFKSILRAIIVDLKEMKLAQGGSTITQQLMKNVFLSQEKSFFRKLKEIILSVYVENNFTKEQIITTYFNEVFWGTIQGINIKGVYAASLLYFGKKPDELNDYETTILVSLLKGPNYYSPLKNWQRLKSRADMVYEKLVSMDLFPPNFEEKWKVSQYEKWEKELKKDQSQKLVYSLLLGQDNKLTVQNSFEKYVFMWSGLNILKKSLEKNKDMNDFAFKAVFLEPFCKNCLEPQYYYSKYERDREKAITTEKHQIGSLIKPIVFDIFYRLGKLNQDLVETKPIKLKLKSGVWAPKDATAATMPLMTLEQSLLESRNIPLIRTAYEVGLDQVEANLKDYFQDLLPLSEYPSQLLGTKELSLDEVANLFKKFILDQCQNLKSGEKTLQDIILGQLSDPNKTTIKNLVVAPINTLKFFHKTGTTNDGFDNWFIAFDGKLLSVIWFGYEGDRSLKKAKTSGASTSFLIFQDYLLNRGKRFQDLSCPMSK